MSARSVAGHLAPLVRALPGVAAPGRGAAVTVPLGDALRLVIGHALAPAAWSDICRDPGDGPPPRISRAAAGDHRAMLLTTHGRGGVDVETRERVARHARPHDAWIAQAERVVVEGAPDPVLELACRWLLKEAYGKALGVGLALPLAALAFMGRGGVVALEGAAAPASAAGWRFTLHRCGDALIGTAHQPTAAPSLLTPATLPPPAAAGR